eukprot:403346280
MIDYNSESTNFVSNTPPTADYSQTDASQRQKDTALESWRQQENMAQLDDYLLKIQKKFINYRHNIFILNDRAQKIQVAFRRYKFKKYQQKLNKRILKISVSQQQFTLPQLNIGSTINNIFQNTDMILNRTQSEYFSSRFLVENVGNVTPTLSERKKSVSFSDPLEEVYIVESFKTSRPGTPLQKMQQIILPLNLSQQGSPNQIKAPQENKASQSVHQSHNINHIKSYFNGSEQNVQTFPNQQNAQVTPQKRLSSRLFNFMNGESSSLLITTELPTIDEVTINHKNQLNSSREFNSTQSHLNRLQKRYVNNLGSPQQNQNQVKSFQLKSPSRNDNILQQTINDIKLSQSVFNKSPQANKSDKKIGGSFIQKGSPKPSCKETITPLKKGITNQEKHTFLQSFKNKNPNLNSSIVTPKPFSLTSQKSPVKQIPPIAVYNSKANFKSPIQSKVNTQLLKSISPLPQKRNNEPVKSQIKDTRANQLRKTYTEQQLKNDTSQTNISKGTSNPSQKLQNQINNVKLQSSRNLNTSINTSQQKIEKADLMNPNFFKRYLELQTSFNDKNTQKPLQDKAQAKWLKFIKNSQHIKFKHIITQILVKTQKFFKQEQIQHSKAY